MHVLRLIMLGPPGAGKGTLSKMLSKNFSVPHISTGALLRQEILEQTELGKSVQKSMAAGNYQADEIVTPLLVQRLGQTDCQEGWILDGYPRTLSQVDALDRISPPTQAIELFVPNRVATQRLRGRQHCPQGHIWHDELRPPRRCGVCDYDGLPLASRPDDTPESIATRLEQHHRETGPVIAIYRQRGLLFTVDASTTVNLVSQDILEHLAHHLTSP